VNGPSLFDTELVKDKHTGEFRILIFDCVMINNFYIGDQTLDLRLKHAKSALIDPIRASKFESIPGIKYFLKDFFSTENLEFLF
jgi:hypothetical protein